MQHHDGVVTILRDVEAPAQTVWDVLSDGWSYAMWVVGASRVREVDEGWPAEGTRIHHSVGLWPALLDDSTHVVESLEPIRLVLGARAWPAGEARVVIEIRQRGAQACTVTIEEDAHSGPGALVPKPIRQLGIGPRNVEALKRLAYLAEGRHRDAGGSGPVPPDGA
ncbi:SRPBCC family protein [Knoellia locipacati]|uniref:SRPBCC family protein n=1 Tax=Knoellia locipacati TaxID=882824 RepID=UPI00384CA067